MTLLRRVSTRAFSDGSPHAFQLHTMFSIFYGHAFNYVGFMENVSTTYDYTPHK